MADFGQLVIDERNQDQSEMSHSDAIELKLQEIWDRNDGSLNMFCDDTDVLLRIAQLLINVKDVIDTPHMKLLRFTYENSTKCFSRDKFDIFIQKRMERFGSDAVLPVTFDHNFQTLINKAKNDEQCVPYTTLLVDLMSKMSCDPKETMFFIVSRGLEIPTLVPVVVSMLTKTFRPICVFKNSHHIFPQLTGIMKFKTSVMKMDIKAIVNLFREFNKSKYRKHGQSVLDLELLVWSWSYPAILSEIVNKQFELFNQLLMSNITGKDRWTKINIAHFVLWFFTALIHNHCEPQRKDLLTETFHLAMKNHVQRKITEEEFVEIKQNAIDILDWDDVYTVYIHQYLEDDASARIKSTQWRTTESLMFIAITDECKTRKSVLLSHDIVEAVAQLCPALTDREMERIFDFMHKHATLDAVVSVWSLAIGYAFSIGKSVEKVMENFVHLVKLKWGLDGNDSDDSGVEDNRNVNIIIESLDELADEICKSENKKMREQLHGLVYWVEEGRSSGSHSQKE